jgi:DNA-binding SARP family transcriptional activator
MSPLTIQLFGKLSVSANGHALERLDAAKVQELLCYLLIHRARPHPRESLAAVLWGDASTEKSKKYLRQALWHLQTVFDARAVETCDARQLLRAEHDWVQINSESGISLDVETFERAYVAARGERGAQLRAETRDALGAAVELYRGDLLEGWYQDWCLFERERLQNLYLLMLDKLMCYCETHDDFEAGQHYGALILRQDRARERTHRQLMALHYRAGDRTAALRQYERCAAALREELNVAPDRRTAELQRQIRADQLDARAPANATGSNVAPAPAAPDDATTATHLSLPEVLGHLRQLQQVVADVQQRINQDIHSIELTLKRKVSRTLHRQNLPPR